jgi:hypothetical protein
MKRLLLSLGLVLLFGAEILRVYFIMPFPGSQRGETISIAYFLHQYIFIIRLLALAMVLAGAWIRFGNWRVWKKVLFILAMILYAAVFYLVNFKFLADKMFYQPQHKILVRAGENKVGMDKLVIAVTINNESKAYPIELIGYHHQVQDTIGGEPVIVTYCTVCRTGRVYSPVLNGKKESFRLVGMDHFNAMFEDNTTKSWWRQVSGEAIAGKLKGTRLKELPSEQMRLNAWLRKHPDSYIMQADPDYLKQYKNLEGFDIGIINSGLEKRDSGSWQFKSWVIGVVHNNEARAYDWNELLNKRMIQDSLGDMPILITIEKDNASFHVFERKINLGNLFSVPVSNDFISDEKGFRDELTNSLWNEDGLCIEGISKGQQLNKVQAYQEFWHSWKSFHPNTTQYNHK